MDVPAAVIGLGNENLESAIDFSAVFQRQTVA